MIIGVVGCGTVGTAVADGFQARRHTVYRHDSNPERSTHTLKDLLVHCQVIFICVPTPTNPDGSQNLGYINKVIGAIKPYFGKFKIPPLIIKSTVLPTTTRKLNHNYNPTLRFSVNPEFLREKTALSDFKHPDRTIIGTEYEDHAKLLCDLYADEALVYVVSSVSAELIKYASNAFLVAKVAFALEIAEAARKLGADANGVLYSVGADKRIGKSHLNPSLGKIPVDSPCLPKDLQAFIRFLEEKKISNGLLKEIWKSGIENDEKT